MKHENQYRVRNHPVLGSDPEAGNNGFFVIPHPKIDLYWVQCQISDGMGWQHVSVSLIKGEKRGKKQLVTRCPTWEEMCWVKSLFWDDEEEVMQLHPPRSQWVNNHPYCLHLWRPDSGEIPLPEAIMVGTKQLNKEENKTA